MLQAVPGEWTTVNGFQSPATAPTGVGTLRLRVRIPADDREWALRVPNAFSAVRVFVNASQVAEIGRVSASREAYIPSNAIALARFRSATGQLEILMQVTNFSSPTIGTWDSPILGDSPAVLAKRQGDVERTSLITGALIIMGLYHLGLFLLRKQDRSSLLFGLICLFMAARNMIMDERLLLDLFPLTAAAWEWAFKLEHFSAHMTVLLFALFFRGLFPREVRR